MGYYTRFSGGVTGPPELLNVFSADAAEGVTYGRHDAELDDWLTGDFFGGDTAKWYGWKEDLVDVSKRYPNLLFFLEGEGEEPGDMWKAWARNGRVVETKARIVFDEPDLDEELPTPNIEKAIAEEKARVAARVQAEIDRLQTVLDGLGLET